MIRKIKIKGKEEDESWTLCKKGKKKKKRKKSRKDINHREKGIGVSFGRFKMTSLAAGFLSLSVGRTEESGKWCRFLI